MNVITKTLITITFVEIWLKHSMKDLRLSGKDGLVYRNLFSVADQDSIWILCIEEFIFERFGIPLVDDGVVFPHQEHSATFPL